MAIVPGKGVPCHETLTILAEALSEIMRSDMLFD